MPGPIPETLVDTIDLLAKWTDRGLSSFDRRGRLQERHAYPEVRARAQSWGSWLLEQGVASGEVVYVCLPDVHDELEAFLGAVLVGARPCLIKAPAPRDRAESFPRFVARLRARCPGHLLTAPAIGDASGQAYLTIPERPDPTSRVKVNPVDPSAIAYLQLTSGSTDTPKLVPIAHRNLVANVRGIAEVSSLRSQERLITWLPMFHDMGLVSTLCALFKGMSVERIVAGAFLEWLRLIARQECRVITAATNSTLRFCVERIDSARLEGLDLSPLRIAFCGAEMIRPRTIDEFTERFRPYGFRGEVLPSYGLAETTLAHTIRRPETPLTVRDGRLSCGAPLPHAKVTIRSVDTGEPVPAGEEGEVVLEGPSLFAGYYLDPEATAEVLRDGAFHTGDLGFLHDGELYICGRFKDLLILNPVHVAAAELEWLADECLGTAGCRGAAFSIEVNDEEVPVLVWEARTVPSSASIRALRTCFAASYAPLSDLVFVRRGTLPVTTSGKIKRQLIKARYLAGQIEALWTLRDDGHCVERVTLRAGSPGSGPLVSDAVALASLRRAIDISLAALPAEQRASDQVDRLADSLCQLQSGCTPEFIVSHLLKVEPSLLVCEKVVGSLVSEQGPWRCAETARLARADVARFSEAGGTRVITPDGESTLRAGLLAILDQIPREVDVPELLDQLTALVSPSATDSAMAARLLRIFLRLGVLRASEPTQAALRPLTRDPRPQIYLLASSAAQCRDALWAAGAKTALGRRFEDAAFDPTVRLVVEANEPDETLEGVGEFLTQLAGQGLEQARCILWNPSGHCHESAPLREATASLPALPNGETRFSVAAPIVGSGSLDGVRANIALARSLDAELIVVVDTPTIAHQALHDLLQESGLSTRVSLGTGFGEPHTWLEALAPWPGDARGIVLSNALSQLDCLERSCMTLRGGDVHGPHCPLHALLGSPHAEGGLRAALARAAGSQAQSSTPPARLRFDCL